MTYSVRPPQQAELALPDGATLVADVWRPDTSEPCPVLLLRQPYGRRIASTIVLAHPAWYASRGYIVAVQDVRGRGGSSGSFRVLADDVEDGARSLSWAAGLEGGDGRVATYGFSYHAVTQYLALAGALRAGTKQPDAMVAVMGAWDIRRDWAYEGGAFRLTLNQIWALQMAAEQARLAGDEAAYEALRAAAEAGAHNGAVAGRPEILDRYRVYSHYREWLEGEPDAFEPISPSHLLQDDDLAIPTLHIGGWFDFMLDGTLAADRKFRAAGGAEHRTVIGPWLHLPWGSSAGQGFGAQACLSIDAEIVSFLDRTLKSGGDHGPAYRLFDTGAGNWRDCAVFPDQPTESLYLTSSGLAATTTSDGMLLELPQEPTEDYLVHDPWRPAPAVGLHLGSPPGYADRRLVDDRTDVAVYSTPVLAKSMTVAGRICAELHVECDCVSYDLNCTLSVVTATGEVMTMAGGHLRVTDAAAEEPRTVPMRAALATVPAGAALRLSIQAAAWPAFAVNPGTGKRPEDASRAEAQVITLRIRHGAGQASRLRFSRA